METRRRGKGQQSEEAKQDLHRRRMIDTPRLAQRAHLLKPEGMRNCRNVTGVTENFPKLAAKTHKKNRTNKATTHSFHESCSVSVCVVSVCACVCACVCVHVLLQRLANEDNSRKRKQVKAHKPSSQRKQAQSHNFKVCVCGLVVFGVFEVA